MHDTNDLSIQTMCENVMFIGLRHHTPTACFYEEKKISFAHILCIVYILRHFILIVAGHHVGCLYKFWCVAIVKCVRLTFQTWQWTFKMTVNFITISDLLKRNDLVRKALVSVRFEFFCFRTNSFLHIFTWMSHIFYLFFLRCSIASAFNRVLKQFCFSKGVKYKHIPRSLKECDNHYHFFEMSWSYRIATVILFRLTNKWFDFPFLIHLEEKKTI